MMELNTKSPFIWDWDNLVVLPSRTADLPKKLHLVDSEFDAIDGLEIGSFHSGESSDLAFGSSSKSSKSASVSDCLSQDPSNRKEISIDSGESLIGLRLGKRTYFENVTGGNSGKISGSVPRRLKVTSQSLEIQHCQVEGCDLDLSSAKDYHRKHRVCEDHSKSPKVVIRGVERRFCQQCSRFHSLSEFDQKKRSCRRRLSDHNARRRKPKPEIIQFNSMGLPSSLHEGRSQISLGFNQVPMSQTRPNANTTWDFTSISELTQEKPGLFQPTKVGGVYAANIARSEAQETAFKVSFDSTPLLPSKSTTSEVFHQGFQVSATSTNNVDAARNLGALSLLSTNTWAPCSQPQGPTSVLHRTSSLNHHHRTSPLDQPPGPPEYWHGDQPPGVQKTAGSNHFQEFRLFKAPDFYSYEDLR